MAPTHNSKFIGLCRCTCWASGFDSRRVSPLSDGLMERMNNRVVGAKSPLTGRFEIWAHPETDYFAKWSEDMLRQGMTLHEMTVEDMFALHEFEKQPADEYGGH